MMTQTIPLICMITALDAPLLAAGNTPWIALAVIGVVRALLCVGAGDPFGDED